MADVIDSFQKYVEAYEYEAETQHWKKDQEEAEQCCRLEGVVQRGLFVYNVLKSADELWSQAVREGKIAYDPEEANSFATLYAGWLRPCHRVLEAIATFENKQYEVERADEFRACVREVRLKNLDVDRALEAIGNVKAGRSIALKDALNGLRRKSRAEGL